MIPQEKVREGNKTPEEILSLLYERGFALARTKDGTIHSLKDYEDIAISQALKDLEEYYTLSDHQDRILANQAIADRTKIDFKI